MGKHPEIQALEHLLKEHRFSVKPIEVHPNFLATEHVWLEVELDTNSFVLLVDDEYQDLALQNSAMNLCLVLRELETYQEEQDILKWTNLKDLNIVNTEVLNYYKKLPEMYKRVEDILGSIHSQISDFDFELNSGAAQELRKHQNS